MGVAVSEGVGVAIGAVPVAAATGDGSGVAAVTSAVGEGRSGDCWSLPARSHCRRRFRRAGCQGGG